MFEISWSELLILGAVTLIFVGPKELPVFLRTLGRYAGSIKRQANEFRGHFNAAMRDVELEGMRQEAEAMKASINSEVMKATRTLEDPPKPSAPAQTAAGSHAAGSGTSGAAQTRSDAPTPTPPRAES